MSFVMHMLIEKKISTFKREGNHLQVVINFNTHLHSFLETRCSNRKNHEFLQKWSTRRKLHPQCPIDHPTYW